MTALLSVGNVGHVCPYAGYTEQFWVEARGGAEHGWGYTWSRRTVFRTVLSYRISISQVT